MDPKIAKTSQEPISRVMGSWPGIIIKNRASKWHMGLMGDHGSHKSHQ